MTKIVIFLYNYSLSILDLCKVSLNKIYLFINRTTNLCIAMKLCIMNVQKYVQKYLQKNFWDFCHCRLK